MAELLDFNTVVTLLVLLWIIIGFMSGKWPMGVVAMTGAVVLELTKVLKFEEAFAYFSSTNVIMVGACFILSGALQKTSLVTKLRQWMLNHASNGTAIVALYLIACWILVQFVAPTALVSMLLPFMNALDKDSKVQPSNLLFPGVACAHACQSTLPVGNTLTAFVTINVMLAANGSNLEVGVFDKMILTIPAALVTVGYFILIGWKLFPARGIDTAQIKEYKDKEITISPAEEKLIYVIFIITMLGIMFAKYLPCDMYVIPVVGVIVLCLTGCMKTIDVRNSLNIDTLFMLCGVLPLATAMQNSNAATLVANTIVGALGGHPSFPVFLLAFMIVGGILTQFMSNTATYNVFCPLAIITAVNLGYDARGVVLAIGCMTTAAMLTPMGSPSLAIAYGAGRYKQGELLKACLPAWILHTAVCFVTTLIIYG